MFLGFSPSLSQPEDGSFEGFYIGFVSCERIWGPRLRLRVQGSGLKVGFLGETLT